MKAGVVQSKDPSVYVEHMVCDRNSKVCMYGECDKCNDKERPLLTPELGKKHTTYEQWVTVDETTDVSQKKSLTERLQ